MLPTIDRAKRHERVMIATDARQWHHPYSVARKQVARSDSKSQANGRPD